MLELNGAHESYDYIYYSSFKTFFSGISKFTDNRADGTNLNLARTSPQVVLKAQLNLNCIPINFRIFIDTIVLKTFFLFEVSILS